MPEIKVNYFAKQKKKIASSYKRLLLLGSKELLIRMYTQKN